LRADGPERLDCGSAHALEKGFGQALVLDQDLRRVVAESGE